MLVQWVRELQEFTQGQPLRHHFMLERNAGPDLMIYLLSILNHTGAVPVLDEPVAQFSTHETSMTVNFEETDLVIGYWLAQVWVSDQLTRRRRFSTGGWCAAYTVRQGGKLILKRVRRRVPKWRGALMGEVVGLAIRAAFSPAGFSFLKSFCLLLLPRRWRPQNPDFTLLKPLLG